ncbi:MAG: DUF4968 domain-containing protein, partial [Promethearchaeota archaeon]
MEKYMEKFELIGNVSSFKKRENEVIFNTSNKIIKIIILSEKIFRIRLNESQESSLEFPPDYSWSIIDQKWDKVDFNTKEDENKIEISTKELIITIEKTPFRLIVSDKENIIWEDAEPAGIGWAENGGKKIYFKKLPRNEHFFGFGEKTGKLDKRGYHYIMKTSESVGYQGKTDPLYQAHPFFIGINRGKSYGIFFDNTWKTFFDMGKKFQDNYFFGAENGELDFYFMYGPSMKEVVSNYTKLIGRILLPPIWSLGFSQCRWGYKNQEILKNITDKLRAHNIPADTVVLDIDYMEGYRVFTWDDKRFPDENFLINLHKNKGFNFIAITDPGVKIDDEYFMYQEGIKNKYFVKKENGEYWKGYVWPGAVHFPDFTKEEVRTWWGDKLNKILDRGISGIWNDMNEPSYNIQPYFHWVKTKNLIFYDHGLNTPFNKNRNVYGLLMARATHEGLLKHQPNKRPWILTRSGFCGIHRYAAVWTGDNTSSWRHLALSIPMLLNMGLSSIPFCGADIGGFGMWFTAPRKLFMKLSRDLITRWHQLGAFYPYARNHSVKASKPQEPWQFGDEVENIIKKYLKLRYRWMPYFYNLFVECSKNGLPPMRPLILEFPDDETCYKMDHQFMWGDSILIAPVVKKKQKIKEVYLPEGEWVNYWTNEKYKGKKFIEIKVDLEDIPIFIKSGAIIACQPDMEYFGEKAINPLIIEIYPVSNGESRFILQEDDGESLQYQKGDYCLTEFILNSNKTQIEFQIHDREGKFKPDRGDIKLIFKSVNKPKHVELNEKAIKESNKVELNKWYYDNTMKNLTI